MTAAAREPAQLELERRAYLACRGLSSLQWDLLEALADGRTVADYNNGAKNLRSAQAAACRALSALERRGLLTRKPKIKLTEAGNYAGRKFVEISTERDFNRSHYRMFRRIFGYYPAVNPFAAVSSTVNSEADA